MFSYNETMQNILLTTDCCNHNFMGSFQANFDNFISCVFSTISGIQRGKKDLEH